MKTNIIFLILFVVLVAYFLRHAYSQEATAERTEWVVVKKDEFKPEDANQIIVKKFIDGNVTCYVSFLTTTWTSAGISCLH